MGTIKLQLVSIRCPFFSTFAGEGEQRTRIGLLGAAVAALPWQAPGPGYGAGEAFDGDFIGKSQRKSPRNAGENEF